MEQEFSSTRYLGTDQKPLIFQIEVDRKAHWVRTRVPVPADAHSPFVTFLRETDELLLWIDIGYRPPSSGRQSSERHPLEGTLREAAPPEGSGKTGKSGEVELKEFYVLGMGGNQQEREKALQLASDQERKALKGLGKEGLCITLRYMLDQKLITSDATLHLQAGSYIRPEVTAQFEEMNLEEIKKYIHQYHPGSRLEEVIKEVPGPTEAAIRDRLNSYLSNEKLVIYYERYGLHREKEGLGFLIPMSGSLSDVLRYCTPPKPQAVVLVDNAIPERLWTLETKFGPLKIISLRTPEWWLQLEPAPNLIIQWIPELWFILNWIATYHSSYFAQYWYF